MCADEEVNVREENESVLQEESNVVKQRCPLCYDNEMYLATGKEFKTHILNYHGQMPAYITFGKDWIEENSKYMDKNHRKKWKKFSNEFGYSIKI